MAPAMVSMLPKKSSKLAKVKSGRNRKGGERKPVFGGVAEGVGKHQK